MASQTASNTAIVTRKKRIVSISICVAVLILFAWHFLLPLIQFEYVALHAYSSILKIRRERDADFYSLDKSDTQRLLGVFRRSTAPTGPPTINRGPDMYLLVSDAKNCVFGIVVVYPKEHVPEVPGFSHEVDSIVRQEPEVPSQSTAFSDEMDLMTINRSIK